MTAAPARDFSTVAKGDVLFAVRREGRRWKSWRFRVIYIAGDTLTGLVCYDDGQPLIYFGTDFRRRSGREIRRPNNDLSYPPKRLEFELPPGCIMPPQSPDQRRAAGEEVGLGFLNHTTGEFHRDGRAAIGIPIADLLPLNAGRRTRGARIPR